MDSNEKNVRKLPLVRYAETTPLFTIEDLRRRYGTTCSDRSVRNVIYRLKKDDRVRSICPGVYTGRLARVPVDRYAVPCTLRPDAVVAFHSALEFHGVANQAFQTVYYLSRRRRADVEYEGTIYRCVPFPQRLLVTEKTDVQVRSAPGNVRVTGRERSLIDGLLRLEYSGGVQELDTALAMFPSFDFETALQYLEILARRWLYSRVGFLLDRHADALFFEKEWRARFLRHVSKSVVYLEGKIPGCRWVKDWNLMVPESFPP